MLSLLLIATLAVQSTPASKPTQDTTASKRTTVAPRGASQAAVSRTIFHDRMRALWSDHIIYTRQFIVSNVAALPDTSEVLQRLLRNQDEIGEAIKPYYGDAAGSQLASLLRSHIQLAGKALVAAKGSAPTQVGMTMTMHDSAYISNRMGVDTVSSRTDTTKIKSNAQNPSAAARMGDTAKAKLPTVNVRVTGDSMTQRGAVRTDSAAQANVHAQGQMKVQTGQQAGQVDTVALTQAVTALKANGDSIATFLSQANPRGFAREPLRGGLQMHIDLLLKEATAHIKKDWSGSVAAFDESLNQANQMADMLSEGIMKQFPSRFTNRTTTVSTR